ncbi:MAG: DUF3048 domain-containing protein [Oscillospiraceae bacterium]|nr:DUF3048 domain-containing protein [Oscillospiraceae bacterium]
MKKIMAFILAMAMLLSGCSGAQQAEAEQPATETAAAAETAVAAATETETVPTEAETEPPVVYYNPLNGTILDAPFDGRIYANTISNIPDALPHVGVTQADILMEMYVNGSIIRCLALFTDIEAVAAIGSTRSTRLMFNDICQHYNAILSHAGGSSQCLADANERGLAHYNVDSLMRQADPLAQAMAYRDKEYKYGEHNLFSIGAGIKAYAESQGVMVSGMPRVDYGLVFAEDGTPANGEDAMDITVTITYGKSKKDTTMSYDAELGKYVYYQYGQKMVDQITGETEAFENVIVMHTAITMNGIYHTADFVSGGTGYFACGGKLIPIMWTCEGEDAPFRFFTQEGEPLALGMGNTYIAICSPESAVVW